MMMMMMLMMMITKVKKVLTYSLRSIDSTKHMARGLSTLVDNLSELTICKCGPND